MPRLPGAGLASLGCSGHLYSGLEGRLTQETQEAQEAQFHARPPAHSSSEGSHYSVLLLKIHHFVWKGGTPEGNSLAVHNELHSNTAVLGLTFRITANPFPRQR